VSCTPGIKSYRLIRTFNCVVPAGGLAPDHSRWIDSQRKFFLPIDVLREVFRGKFIDGLRKLHTEHKLGSHGSLIPLQNPKTFAAWLRPLFRSHSVVYCKRPFGGAEHALRYLGQYNHRVGDFQSPPRLPSTTDASLSDGVRMRTNRSGNTCSRKRRRNSSTGGVLRFSGLPETRCAAAALLSISDGTPLTTGTRRMSYFTSASVDREIPLQINFLPLRLGGNTSKWY
jgi:hypothetical protein